jgi:hypothetical protein
LLMLLSRMLVSICGSPSLRSLPNFGPCRIAQLLPAARCAPQLAAMANHAGGVHPFMRHTQTNPLQRPEVIQC